MPKDKEITEQFKNLSFNLDECLRLLANPDPLFIASKMISFVDFSYLSGKRGIHVTAALLGIENPWERIAERLGRGEEELKKLSMTPSIDGMTSCTVPTAKRNSQMDRPGNRLRMDTPGRGHDAGGVLLPR